VHYFKAGVFFVIKELFLSAFFLRSGILGSESNLIESAILGLHLALMKGF
jgi:hypothetical protein